MVKPSVDFVSKSTFRHIALNLVLGHGIYTNIFIAFNTGFLEIKRSFCFKKTKTTFQNLVFLVTSCYKKVDVKTVPVNTDV